MKNIDIQELSIGTKVYWHDPAIGGKILYRESDIEELLEKNRQEAFQ